MPGVRVADQGRMSGDPSIGLLGKPSAPARSAGSPRPQLARRHVLRRRGEEGQAMVEFALVLPVLLLVLVAILKFGLTFENYLTLTDAVRAGSRQLAVGRGSANACTSATNLVQSSASGLNTANLTVTTSLTSPDTCTSLTEGNAATVSATYPCDLTVLGINFFPSCKLTASATERVE
jgi:Flp pilus assembly protein TadG